MDFSPNLMRALILRRYALGLLSSKFRQFLAELSAHNTIMAGYYHFTFYYLCPTASKIITHMQYSFFFLFFPSENDISIW